MAALSLSQALTDTDGAAPDNVEVDAVCMICGYLRKERRGGEMSTKAERKEGKRVEDVAVYEGG